MSVVDQLRAAVARRRQWKEWERLGGVPITCPWCRKPALRQPERNGWRMPCINCGRNIELWDDSWVVYAEWPCGCRGNVSEHVDGAHLQSAVAVTRVAGCTERHGVDYEVWTHDGSHGVTALVLLMETLNTPPRPIAPAAEAETGEFTEAELANPLRF